MTEREIQALLFFSIGVRRWIAFPNVQPWGVGECDLFTITYAMYTDEYEIKTARGDFLKDKKKRKWNYQKTGWGKNRYANRFWYVCPTGLIKPDEVQDFAGLMYVKDDSIEIIKQAVKRHKEKFTDEGVRRLLQKGMWKYWNIIKENRRLKVIINKNSPVESRTSDLNVACNTTASPKNRGIG